MTRAKYAFGAIAAVLVLIAVAAGYGVFNHETQPVVPPSPAIPSGTSPASAEASQGFLYGRVTKVDGAILEGRLRFGGNEEACWGDYFNGSKHKTRGSPRFRRARSPRSGNRSRSSESRSRKKQRKSISVAGS